MSNFLKMIYCIIGMLCYSTTYSQKECIDLVGSKIKILDGYLDSYTDSNVFVYRSKVYGTRDTEKVYPKSFEIKLPKGIMYFQLHDQERFEFFYGRNQVIFVKTDFRKKDAKDIDTVYSPSLTEIYDLINFDEYIRSDTSKYVLKKIPFKKGRKTTVIKKGNATILLYNIISERHSLFLRLVKQFEFL